MDKKNVVLIVDDVELNRALLRDMLEDEYQILEAANGKEAVNLIQSKLTEISVVLLDAVMPEMDGFEVLAVMNDQHWIDSIPVIMISAETSPEFIEKGYRLGAIDYISRPYSAEIVMHRVKNTIVLYAKQIHLEQIVKEQIREREDNSSLMVDILSTIVEFRNGESGVHVKRIRIITEILLEALMKKRPDLSLSMSEIVEISNAAALHDVGKIAIPEEILNKPAKLTAIEFDIMKEHSAKGAQMLENIHYGKQEKVLRYAKSICHWHHERWDGGGYPDGLKGDEIPLCAQVVALADVYDALVSKRVYKPAFTKQVAMEMIMKGECGAFNPELLDCLKLVGSSLENRIKLHADDSERLFDAEKISKEIISKKESSVSDRTIALLEQERIKYHFYAALSNEILFEYDLSLDELSFSEKGVNKLNVPVRIPNASQWLKSSQLIRAEDYDRICEQMTSSTVDNPIINMKCLVFVKDDQPTWYELTMRTMWTSDLTQRQYGCIGKLVDIHEQKAAEELLKELAECDSLTALYNHRTAKKKICEVLPVTESSALLFFDMDNFKLVNDTYGHMAGDSVLKKLGKIVLSNIEDTDIAARIGGDEFMVYFQNVENEKDLEDRVSRLWNALQIKQDDQVFTVSMGVSVYPRDGDDYETLLLHADNALYNCKSQGKNQYAFYKVND